MFYFPSPSSFLLTLLPDLRIEKSPRAALSPAPHPPKDSASSFAPSLYSAWGTVPAPEEVLAQKEVALPQQMTSCQEDAGGGGIVADPEAMAWCSPSWLCSPSVPGVELQGRCLVPGNDGECGSPQHPGLSSSMQTKLARFLPEDKKKKEKAKQTPRPLFRETRAAACSDGIYFVLGNSIHSGSGCGRES